MIPGEAVEPESGPGLVDTADGGSPVGEDSDAVALADQKITGYMRMVAAASSRRRCM